jgi:hypothetical protein
LTTRYKLLGLFLLVGIIVVIFGNSLIGLLSTTVGMVVPVLVIAALIYFLRR